MSFYVVTGPPCSGKSTWVAERIAGITAVVLDLDALRVALGSPSSHHHSPRLLDFAMASRDACVAEWRRRGTHAPPLYYISCWPSLEEEASFPGYATRIKMPTSKDECKRRAVAAGRPSVTSQWIDDWFRKQG